LDQVNGGEMFSPTQFGLDLSFPANFFASLPLSSKADELSTNVSEPEVGPSAAKDAEAAMAAMKYVTAALTATSSPASDESLLFLTIPFSGNLLPAGACARSSIWPQAAAGRFRPVAQLTLLRTSPLRQRVNRGRDFVEQRGDIVAMAPAVMVL
jgi:hypothetical protein